jgi:pyridoxamine 5'-phosphate oxidase
MKLSLPDHYDDLWGSFDHAWDRIEAAVKERETAFHTPVVASLGADGAPRMRVMVLRAADRRTGLLRLHTDQRSAKAREFAADDRGGLLFYDAPAKLQLRLTAKCWIETESPEADRAWEATTLFGKRCYLGPIGPGAEAGAPTSGLPADVEGRQPTKAQTEPGRGQFAVLRAEVFALEWLFLAQQGHRRALFKRQETGWTGGWLIP